MTIEISISFNLPEEASKEEVSYFITLPEGNYYFEEAFPRDYLDVPERAYYGKTILFDSILSGSSNFDYVYALFENNFNEDSVYSDSFGNSTSGLQIDKLPSMQIVQKRGEGAGVVYKKVSNVPFNIYLELKKCPFIKIDEAYIKEEE